MWLWRVKAAEIVDPDGIVLSTKGYSGKGSYKNNPEFQDQPNEGPIPMGYYTIGEPHDTVTHGPFVLPLEPDPKNVMFGRSHFLIHGDSVVSPGTASMGCIILPRAIRQEIARSLDKLLMVV